MLYEEFLAGTGCKDRACNYQVYVNLEILYMNSDLTKEQIYEYGKKLVDNSLTEEQIKWNADIDEQIAEMKQRIKSGKEDIERYKSNLEWAKRTYFGDELKEEIKFWKRAIADEWKTIKNLRSNIRMLKECKYS